MQVGGLMAVGTFKGLRPARLTQTTGRTCTWTTCTLSGPRRRRRWRAQRDVQGAGAKAGRLVPWRLWRQLHRHMPAELPCSVGRMHKSRRPPACPLENSLRPSVSRALRALRGYSWHPANPPESWRTYSSSMVMAGRHLGPYTPSVDDSGSSLVSKHGRRGGVDADRCISAAAIAASKHKVGRTAPVGDNDKLDYSLDGINFHPSTVATHLRETMINQQKCRAILPHPCRAIRSFYPRHGAGLYPCVQGYCWHHSQIHQKAGAPTPVLW